MDLDAIGPCQAMSLYLWAVVPAETDAFFGFVEAESFCFFTGVGSIFETGNRQAADKTRNQRSVESVSRGGWKYGRQPVVGAFGRLATTSPEVAGPSRLTPAKSPAPD